MSISPAICVQPYYCRTITSSAVYLQGDDDDLFKNGNLNPNAFEKSAKQSGKLSIKLRMQVRSCVAGTISTSCNIFPRGNILHSQTILHSACALTLNNTVYVSKHSFSWHLLRTDGKSCPLCTAAGLWALILLHIFICGRSHRAPCQAPEAWLGVDAQHVNCV